MKKIPEPSVLFKGIIVSFAVLVDLINKRARVEWSFSKEPAPIKGRAEAQIKAILITQIQHTHKLR